MLLQEPDGREAVHGVSGQAGNRLRDDKVDLAREGVLNHVVKLLALAGTGAGDNLVYLSTDFDTIIYVPVMPQKLIK